MPTPLCSRFPEAAFPLHFNRPALPADLDILLVRKIGVPGQEELAMGAIASCGTRVLNEPLITYLEISQAAVSRQ